MGGWYIGSSTCGKYFTNLRTLFLKSRCNSMDKTAVKSTLSIKWTCQLALPLSLSGTHDVGLGSVSSKFFNKVLRLTRNKRILISLKFRSPKYVCLYLARFNSVAILLPVAMRRAFAVHICVCGRLTSVDFLQKIIIGFMGSERPSHLCG